MKLENSTNFTLGAVLCFTVYVIDSPWCHEDSGRQVQWVESWFSYVLNMQVNASEECFLPSASATKSVKVTSSKKKIPKTTPRTGPRRGRKAKLEGKYEATPSTPAPEEGKGPREESGERLYQYYFHKCISVIFAPNVVTLHWEIICNLLISRPCGWR